MQAMSKENYLEKDWIRHAEIPPFSFLRMDEVPMKSPGIIKTHLVSISTSYSIPITERGPV